MLKSDERYPTAYQGKGVMVLGDQTVAWTGDRLLVNPVNAQTSRWFGESPFWRRDLSDLRPYPGGIPAYSPTARVTPLFDEDGPSSSDSALGKKYRLFVSPFNGGVQATVISRETGAIVYRGNIDSDESNVTACRAIYSDNRFVVFFLDGLGNLVKTSAYEATPHDWVLTSLVGVCDGDFDIAYINASFYLLAWRDGAAIKAAYYVGSSTYGAFMTPGDSLQLGGTPSGAFGVTVDPSGIIGVVYAEAATTSVEALTADGSAFMDRDELDPETCVRCTIASRWVDITNGQDPVFVAYASIVADEGVDHHVTVGKYQNGFVDDNDKRVYYDADIRTRAWRVGEETFCWLVSEPSGPDVQDTYHLVGGAGQSVMAGYLAPGEAFAATGSHINSVLPDPLYSNYGAANSPTTSKWYCVLQHADEQTAPDNAAQVSLVDVDFLPELRWARMGNALYTAGAIVQTYDGHSFVEAGWTQFPGVYSAISSNTAEGGMVPANNYYYRVYACWRNASGELFRSPAATSGPHIVEAGDDTLTVYFTAMPFTTKPLEEVFFEIYRNDGETAGTTFRLVGRVQGNTFSSRGISFVDIYADVELVGRPIDPHNPAIGAPAELEEIAPPGCEGIIVSGSRLWLFGGAIPHGIVAFTKLKEYGEGVGWNDLVGTYIVDAANGKIVSLAHLNDALVILQGDRIFLVGGPGPDNLGNGSFSLPTPIPVNDGALYDVTITGDPGVIFWARGGPRLLTTGLQIVDIGAPVEPLASTLRPTGVIAIPTKREYRWYTAEGRALLWDFTATQEAGWHGRWAVWTGLPAAGVARVNDGAVLVGPNGDVLIEDSTATDDGGAHFALTFTTWEIRPGELASGNNVVHRIGLTGIAKGPHKLRVWVYYDGSRMWEEYIEWDASHDLALSPVSEVTALVQTFNSVGQPGPYRFDKALRRRPMSTVRVRFSDGGSHTDTFEPHEASFEIGARTGLSRVPIRTFPVVTCAR
jgi:hypothetical protein